LTRLAIKTTPRVPLTITGEGPISVARNVNSYVVDYRPDLVAATAVPDGAEILVWNPATQSSTRATVYDVAGPGNPDLAGLLADVEAAVADAEDASAAVVTLTLDAGTDFNILVSRQVALLTSALNAPLATAGLRWQVNVWHDPSDADIVVQHATLADGGTDARLFFRRRNAVGTWSAWAEAGAAQIDTSRRVDGKGLFWDATTSKHVYAWASPLDATIDLRDLLDEQHGVGGWTQRTGVNTGTDCTSALELGLDRLRSRYGRGRILIPPGIFLFKSNIAAAKLSGNIIEGVHELASQMVFTSGSSHFLFWTGSGGYSGGGIRKMGLYREDGFTSLYDAIRLEGDATYQPDQFNIEDIYMSALGSGYWQNNLYLTGISRTSPQGLRVGRVSNAQLFRSGSGSGFGAGFYNCVQWHVQNLGTYAGTGSLGMNVYVGGGGASNTNTTQFTLERLACGSELNLTNHTRAMYDGFCSNLSMGATADYLWGWIDAASTAGAVGSNSNLTIR
jgi:hypothetical protein